MSKDALAHTGILSGNADHRSAVGYIVDSLSDSSHGKTVNVIRAACLAEVCYETTKSSNACLVSLRRVKPAVIEFLPLFLKTEVQSR